MFLQLGKRQDWKKKEERILEWQKGGLDKMKDEIVKALDNTPSYDEMSLADSEGGYNAFKKLRQLEAVYEQSQDSGVDVFIQLRERRYQILETVFDYMSCDIDNAEGEVKARQKIVEMSIPALKRAVGLLEEYVQKIDPNSPALEDNGWLE
jgi:hypothetical protein